MSNKGLSLEVLVATMGQSDYSILNGLNLESDAVVCNQKCQEVKLKCFEYNGNNISWYNYKDKGLSLNRNYALLQSTADICVVADDDVTYKKGYKEMITKAFSDHPEADVLLFNIDDGNSGRIKIKKDTEVNILNFGKFCSVRIAFRRKSILKAGISFNNILGAGSEFFSGEDLAFLRDCLRKKLKIVAVPVEILTLDTTRESSWFSGFNSELYEVMGATYYYYFGSLAYVVCLIQLIRKKKTFLSEANLKTAYNSVCMGISIFKKYR